MSTTGKEKEIGFHVCSNLELSNGHVDAAN